MYYVHKLEDMKLESSFNCDVTCVTSFLKIIIKNPAPLDLIIQNILASQKEISDLFTWDLSRDQYNSL